MPTLSSFVGASPQVVVLSFASAAVTTGSVLEYTATYDPSSRWDAVNFRITASANEVWRVRMGSYATSGTLSISAFKNGSNAGLVMPSGSGTDAQQAWVGVAGTTVVLEAADYIDLRVTGTDTLGTHTVVCERVAW